MAATKRAPAKGITRATRPEVDDRVLHIVDRMRSLGWIRGTTNRALAKEWGVTVAAVNDYASEAARRVRAEVTDPSEVTGTVATTLAGNLEAASLAGEYRAVASLADVWTRIVGARAPERHEHAVVVAQYEALPPKQRAQWLRDRAATMLAEAARLDAESP